MFICRLDKKLHEVAGDRNNTKTVWGRGYVLQDQELMVKYGFKTGY